MSSMPELVQSSPRRRPSAATLRSPSRNASISRSNSTSSNTPNNNTNNSTTTTVTTTSTADKKPSRGEEYLNNLPDDPEQTVIHSPRTYTPPLIQSPENAFRRTRSDSEGNQQSNGSYNEGSRQGSGSSSPDRTIMPLPVDRSGRVEGNGPVTPTEEEADDESNGSVDDLLVQLPDYDWPGFLSRFSETLKEVGAEKERLSMEHDMWNWMYEIWSSSRDRDDTRRLSREMATIIQWTKLKEADLERAREAHTQSMLAISSVLGIAPKNATPPPSVAKKKRVQR